MAFNDQATTSIASWNPDAVEPQLGYPAISFTIKLAPSTTYPKGRILGELTATPGTYGLYADANADGTGVAKCVLPRQVTTDAAGLIYDGAQASNEETGYSQLTAPAFFGGIFKTQDLVGIDAAAVTDLGGKVIFGDLTSGYVKF